MAIVKVLLSPLSLLYGVITGARNFLFRTGLLKSRHFKVPIICVGNITVGGTGKTPHTEMLIAELKKEFRVACLSRGYKRKTSGFVLATADSTAREIGDEPKQIKQKFPDIIVACDSKRVRGIEKLMALPEPPEVIVLDDAFQHRYVQADKNIVLMDYNRPVYQDMLLPAGRLRENMTALKRADYIICTKCPAQLLPIERRIVSKHLKIKPYQQLFFTTQTYGSIRQLGGETASIAPGKSSTILCVTGIAQPAPYIAYLKTLAAKVVALPFADHHDFSERNIKEIERKFEEISSREKYIFTTEKDAVRLQEMKLPNNLKRHIYYVPVTPAFLQREDILLHEISEYVRKYQK